MSVQTGLTLERALVEALSRRRREPSWASQRRLEAFEQFEALPLPQWDRTDLAGMDLASMLARAARFMEEAPGTVERPDPTRRLEEALDLPSWAWASLQEDRPGCATLVSVATADGRQMVLSRTDPELVRRGVVVTSLQEALDTLEEVVRRHFMSQALPASFGKFPALSGALWDAGALVYVPRGVEVEGSIEVLTWAAGQRPALFPRTLVILEQESRVRLVETWGSSASAEPVLVAGGVEIVAGPASQLDYACLQYLDPSAVAFVNRRAVLDRDSQVEWAVGEFGAGLTRAEFETLLEGQGSASHSLMVFFASTDQHLDLLNVMHHQGSHSESDIVARGVLNDQARGIYRAVTHIHRGARHSGSWQKGNVLVLNNDARADANPSVVVEESEVQRAGHAATVGRVDPEQLFYLMSRGLPERSAIQLIVEGFLQPVLERIPIEAVRDQMRAVVAQRLQGGL